LTTSSEESGALNPWDNPVVGEQTATVQDRQSSVKSQEKVQASKTIAQQQKEKDKLLKNQSQGEGANAGVGTNAVDGNMGNSPEMAANKQGPTNESKVVCTELVRQGKMTETERRACTIYAYSRLPSSFMQGYHFWAVPYVRLMRKSMVATKLIVPIVTHRTREVCYRLGLRKTGSFFGKMICAVHDPICSFIGPFVSKTNYHCLYEKEART